MTTRQLNFRAPPSLAIAEGATTPNPGIVGSTAWSTTLGKLVVWNGSAWTSLTGDPWTHIKLAADFTTQSTSLVDVTGMSFAPVANAIYAIEGMLLMRTATATTAPRPAIAWPTGGVTDAVADLRCSASATTEVLAFGNSGAAVQNLNTGLVNATASWPGSLQATLVMGASPAGSVRLQIASETALTNVTLKAGSWLRYRTL